MPSVQISPEAKQAVTELTRARKGGRSAVVNEAILLYHQAVVMADHGVRASEPALEEDSRWVTIENEKMYIRDNALMRIERAAEDFFGRSKWTFYKWDAAGVFSYEDGTPIPIYRSKRGHHDRWFSPQNLWDIVAEAERRKLVRSGEAYRIRLRIQQAFIEQQARHNIARLREVKS